MLTAFGTVISQSNKKDNFREQSYFMSKREFLDRLSFLNKTICFFKVLYSLVIIFFLQFSTFAQNRTIDGLKKILSSLKDSARVDCLNELSEVYRSTDTVTYNINKIDSVEFFAQQAFSEARKINYIYGQAKAVFFKGIVAFEKYNNYQDAEKLARESIALYEKTANKKGMNRTYYELGHALYVLSSFEDALKSFAVSYDLSKKANDLEYVFYSVINSGFVYLESGDYKSTFEKLTELHEMVLKHPENKWKFWELAITGNLYASLEDYKTALAYNQQIYQITQPTYYGDLIGTADLFCLNRQFDSARHYYNLVDTTIHVRALRFYLASIGKYYFLQGEYNKALSNYLRGLEYHKQVNDHNQVMYLLVELAKTYDSIHDYPSSLKYAHEALTLSSESGARQIVRDCYQVLYSVFDRLQQTDSALSYYKKYIAIKDSITVTQTAAKLIAYNFDQKIELLNKEKEVQQIQLQKQSLLKNILVGGIIVLLLLAGIIFRNILLKRRNEKQRLEYKLERQQLETEIESQRALSNERLRISRELHDDIGSTLGSISIYSEVARKRTEKSENTKEVLSKIGLASRELIDKMSDIVWSLNYNNEGFEQLQNRMTDFAAMILTPRHIHYHHNADEGLKQMKLTSEQRKNIFLIFKEAVHNIVKYANCKKVNVELSLDNNDFVMMIQDDGKGFDGSRIAVSKIAQEHAYIGGNGIKNMHARAMDMQAKLCIYSNINEGTTVQLVLPL
jgi:signal transduction histidine kinase